MSDIQSAKVSYILRAHTANLQAQAAWDQILEAAQTLVNEVALDYHRFIAKQVRGSIFVDDVPTACCSPFLLDLSRIPLASSRF